MEGEARRRQGRSPIGKGTEKPRAGGKGARIRGKGGRGQNGLSRGDTEGEDRGEDSRPAIKRIV